MGVANTPTSLGRLKGVLIFLSTVSDNLLGDQPKEPINGNLSMVNLKMSQATILREIEDSGSEMTEF